MKQLVLDLGADPAHSLDTFQVGENAELAHLMHQFAQRASREHFAYLWGDTGAGKTHLLQALAATRSRATSPATPARRLRVFAGHDALPARRLRPPVGRGPDRRLRPVQPDPRARRLHGLTGPVPPAVLPVREDLRTRMGWGLIYLIHGLSDDQKIAALTQAAEARGLTLSASVLPYLLSHFKRDMRSLATMLDALDQYSLETQRPVTLPLLRDLLQGNPQSEPKE
jgi:DnaA family protein